MTASYGAYAASYDTLNDGGGAGCAAAPRRPRARAGSGACGPAGLPKLCSALLARASSNVLQISAGTGLNLPLYRLGLGAAVRTLTGTC